MPFTDYSHNQISMTDLDLREESIIAARLEEGINGVVRSVGCQTGVGASDRRLPAGHVGTTISHRRRRKRLK